MNTELVEAVAMKVGAAADRLAPLANTLVEETARKYWLYGLVLLAGGLVGTVAMVLVFRAWMAERRKPVTVRDETPYIFSFGMLALFTFSMFAPATDVIGRAMAPTCTLLQNLK